MPIINTVTGGGTGKPAKLVSTTVEPASFPVTYTPPEGFDGWSDITVTKPQNLDPENIRKGVSIASVEGTYESVPNLQNKDVKPAVFPTEVVHDEGYGGLGTVTVEAPDNLEAENIKEGVDIAGIIGTYSGTVTTVGLKELLTNQLPASLEIDCENKNVNCYFGASSLQNLKLMNCGSEATITYGPSLCNLRTFEITGNLKRWAIDLSKAAKLLELTIPDTVTSIYGNVSYAAYIPVIHIKPTTPPYLSSSKAFWPPSKTTFYVPRGSLEAYKTATNWSTYADYMVEADE